jgi:hypothetical protein
MRFNRAWLWAAGLGVIALVATSALVEDPGIRAPLAVLCIIPLLQVTVRFALASQQQSAQDRRKYMRLRTVTDEFIMHVRNLNRLKVIAQGRNPPEDIDRMMEEVVQRMHATVDRIRSVAGQESPPPER